MIMTIFTAIPTATTAISVTSFIVQGSGRKTNGAYVSCSKYLTVINQTNKLLNKYVLSFYLDKYTLLMTWKAKFKYRIF